jgi:hypothetical protein
VRNCTKWWGPNSHIPIYYIEQSRDEIYLVTSAKGEWHSQASWEFCRLPCHDALHGASWVFGYDAVTVPLAWIST